MGSASDEDDEDRGSDVESTVSLGSTILKEDSDDSSLNSARSASATLSSIVGDDFNDPPPYNPSSPILSDVSSVSLSSVFAASPASPTIAHAMTPSSYTPALPPTLDEEIHVLQGRYNTLMVRASLEVGPATVSISINFCLFK